jgi:hypothetical protein
VPAIPVAGKPVQVRVDMLLLLGSVLELLGIVLLLDTMLELLDDGLTTLELLLLGLTHRSAPTHSLLDDDDDISLLLELASVELELPSAELLLCSTSLLEEDG